MAGHGERSRCRRWSCFLGALVLVVAGAACGSDNGGNGDKGGGEIFGGRNGSGANAGVTAASGGGVVLAAPGGTAPATLSAAAAVVRARLARMGVADADVSTSGEGVVVRSSADLYQLRAAAQSRATNIAAVESSAVGPCQGPGSPSIGSATRCYVLGQTLTGTGAIGGVQVIAASGAGWKLTFSVDQSQYQAFRSALAAGGQRPLAVVSDGAVVLSMGAGLPALQSAIGPPLAEDTARLAAAALVVTDDLPVALQAPALPAPPGARVDLDFWTAALGVDICGMWLGNAPASGLETGVHSHGDGLVYVHPFNGDEAGDRATLGLFLERGGWTVSADRLQLWDGADHHTGDRCPDGQAAQVRWFVDGVEQHGDPGTFTPRNGQVIVLSFGAAAPGVPPQLASLYVPALGAAT